MITKIAQEFTEDVGHITAMKAINRATRKGTKGINSILPNKELSKNQLKDGSLYGVGGAGIGALIGATVHNPILGGLLGGGIGTVMGTSHATNKYLSNKGIKHKWLGGYKMTRAAKKQYAY